MLVSWCLLLGQDLSFKSANMACHRVRHEAAEALGAIGTDKCECMLRQYEDDDTLEVGHVSCLCKLPAAALTTSAAASLFLTHNTSEFGIQPL